jgi:hypothetical protein
MTARRHGDSSSYLTLTAVEDARSQGGSSRSIELPPARDHGGVRKMHAYASVCTLFDAKYRLLLLTGFFE